MIGRLWSAFFLIGMSPGFYYPALTNILTAQGLDSSFVQWTWLAGPLAAMISPVFVGSLADNRFAGQKVLGWLGILSAVLLAASFRVLETDWPKEWFIVLEYASAIVGAPLWSMMASLCLVHLRSGENEFPIVRMGGTAGWIVAGLLLSFVIRADTSPMAGYFGALARLAGGLFCFSLPATPPLGRSRSLRTLFGIDAFRLLKERDHAVFFVTTALLSMPLTAFYMWTPKHLAETGDGHVAATMALGQISEVVAMLVVAVLLRRFRVKTLLVVSLALTALRYGLFAWSGWSGAKTGLIAGVTLHGLCYTLYFITAQLFLDRRVPVEVRSQAQGLIALFSSGIGSLAGTFAVRAWYDHTVTAGHGGWAMFWAALGGFLLLLTIGFSVAYVGTGPRSGRSSW
ncbi:putative nucleoside transporter YegT [Haloferula sargassicola]|uniref:Nucleoside transporter YegT n=1 Tax=Haloferula sargassicola TaxID=490096 RepID=A0ABP9UT44_9BACT